jgi:Ca-activated chloride channel family protein
MIHLSCWWHYDEWVTEEQRIAAQEFTRYVLTVPVQELIMSYGFRPANPAVALADPFVEENGVDPAGPPTLLELPDVDVMLAIQESWSSVRKQGDIMLLIDVSGSMLEDNKIGQAQQAALAFLDGIESGSRIGLAVFSDEWQVLVPIGPLETSEAALREAIGGLQANGGTSLHAAIRETVNLFNAGEDEGRIRAVVLLSDGKNETDNPTTLNEAIQAILDSQNSLNPVFVFPVAYGNNADTTTLNRIGRTSSTIVRPGDPGNILDVLQEISGYF